MVTETAHELERAQHGLTSPEIRSVVDANCSPPPFCSHRNDRMSDAQSNGRRESSIPPGFRIALTGYRLLTTTVIVGIGIPKAIYSYNGQSIISPTLDWLGGVVFGILLV